MKPHLAPPIDPDLLDPEIESILHLLAKSGGWSTYNGPYGDLLVEQLSAIFLRQHVQLCCSGTLGTELALRGCRVGEGDEVLLAGYDFPGNFRAIEAVGGTVALVDIPLHSWSLDTLDELEQGIGPRTRALIVSHLHGTLAKMATISQWAKARGLWLIEDACQAPGAMVDGRPVGSWGDCSVLSFGGSKLLSAGRGGAVLTDDPRIDQRMRIYRERGNDAFAMSELQSAVLGPQLRALQARHQRRATAVARLEALVRGWPCIELAERTASLDQHAFYKWGLRIASSGGAVDSLRDAFIACCIEQGVWAGAGFRGFARRSADRCRRPSTLDHSTNAATSTVVFHHTALNDSTAAIFPAIGAAWQKRLEVGS